MRSLADQVLVVVPLCRSRWSELALEEALAALVGSCILFFDNGEVEAPAFALPWRLIQDGTNPGVGPRYAQAARVAKECGLPYLLLLDQDFAPPSEWWQAFETSVQTHPRSQAWAPRLVCDDIPLSPFRLHRGRPAGASPSGEILLAGEHVVLNSGLLIRTDALLPAADALALCPLDFSDFALSWELGKQGGCIAPIALTLEHFSSTHARTSRASRLARFAWFAHGARGWRQVSSAPWWRLAGWVGGRAVKLAWQNRDVHFLQIAWTHFVLGRRP